MLIPIFILVILSVAIDSKVKPKKEEKPEYKICRFKDANGGKDWIVEVIGDIIKSQYREGEKPDVSSQAGVPQKQSWKNRKSIPYAIHPAYSAQEKQTIAAALKHITDQTKGCVHFTPWNKEPNYLYVQKGEGCTSYVGMKGGQQFVSLGGGCVSQGAIIHEFTHALGFDHTQCRSDRDKYVEIYFQNIIPKYHFAFYKEKTNNELVPFDYQSVMIYSPKDFTTNNQLTMKSKDPKHPLLEANKRTQLSKLDIEMIRKLYKC